MLKKWVEKLRQAMSGTKTQGFTLIEIVIVLAIAGLIFVIVFLAVSQAQAARRDTQRKTDANKFVAALNQYAGNNSGSLPLNAGALGNGLCGAPTATFCNTYLGGNAFLDPNGTAYSLTYSVANPLVANMSYSNNEKCNGNGVQAGTVRQFVVLYFQERGGTVCVDNQ